MNEPIPLQTRLHLQIAKAESHQLTNRKLAKLAEFRGWVVDVSTNLLTGSLGGERGYLPEYFTDLNEIRELETHMTPEQLSRRVTVLVDICDEVYGCEVLPSDVLDPIEMSSMFLSCPAEYRAEAVGVALGLWTMEECFQTLTRRNPAERYVPLPEELGTIEDARPVK